MSSILSLGNFPDPTEHPIPHLLSQAFGAASILCLMAREPNQHQQDAAEEYRTLVSSWNALAKRGTSTWQELQTWCCVKSILDRFLDAGIDRLDWYTVWPRVAPHLRNENLPGDIVWSCWELKKHQERLQGANPLLPVPVAVQHRNGDTCPPHSIETALSQAQEPQQQLIGWREITDALERNSADRDTIKSLNERYEGPIQSAGQGSQPMVSREKLIDWWNKLEIRYQERKNQQEGKRLSAEQQHNYGREGIAAPEVGGEVRKRRGDKRT